MVMKGSVNTEVTNPVLSLRLVIAKITDLGPSTEASTLAEIKDSMPVYVVCN